MKLIGAHRLPSALKHNHGPRSPDKCLRHHAHRPLENRFGCTGRISRNRDGSRLAMRGLAMEEENIVDQDFMEELNKVLVYPHGSSFSQI